MHFNVSHSGKWAVCAVSDSPVGIDIQEIKPVNFSIANRFFSASENEMLINAQGAARQELFYKLWVLKESYVKMLGKGLSMRLDSFSIKIDGENISLLSPVGHDQCFFKLYDACHGYKMAVCGMENKFPDNVETARINILTA